MSIRSSASGALPQSWSVEEVCGAFHIGADNLSGLIRDGKVGYIRAGRSRRFLQSHVDQLVAALEVRAAADSPDSLARLGVTSRSAARRRSA